MRFKILVLAVLGALALGLIPAAGQPTAATALTQPTIPADVGYHADIVYCTCADGQQLKLDIAWPQGGNRPSPAVLCIHGGGWMMPRDHATYRALIVKLAKEGYVGVSVTFRLAPTHPFPAAIHDVKCAVRWLRANAAKYGIDKERIAALGYSSGGHLACMLATTTGNEWEGNGGCAGESSQVQAVVSFYGVTDLNRWHQHKNPLAKMAVEKFLGGTPDEVGAVCAKASPVQHANGNCPPALFIHGTDDQIVPFEQSQLLRDRLEACGLRPELVNLKGAGHNFDAQECKHKQVAYAALFDFLNRHLKSDAMAGREVR